MKGRNTKTSLKASTRRIEPEPVPVPTPLPVEDHEDSDTEMEAQTQADPIPSQVSTQQVQSTEDSELEELRRQNELLRQENRRYAYVTKMIPGMDAVHTVLRRFHQCMISQQRFIEKCDNSKSADGKTARTYELRKSIHEYCKKNYDMFVEAYGEWIPDLETALNPPKKIVNKKRKAVSVEDSVEGDQTD